MTKLNKHNENMDKCVFKPFYKEFYTVHFYTNFIIYVLCKLKLIE